MTRRVTVTLRIQVTRTLYDALAAKAERLHLRWEDVARTALAREVTRESVDDVMDKVGELPDDVLTELTDHIRLVVAEWRDKEEE